MEQRLHHQRPQDRANRGDVDQRDAGTQGSAVPSSIRSEDGNLILYLFPQLHESEGNNFYTRALAPVSCAGGTRVDFAQYLWNRNLLSVARRLVALKKHGCAVRVSLTKSRTDGAIRDTLARGQVPVRWSDTPNQSYYSHEKVIAISGRYGGKHVETIFEGSLNLTIGFIHGFDDNMLRVVDARRDGTYARTLAAFNSLWKYSTPAPLWSRWKVRYHQGNHHLWGTLSPSSANRHRRVVLEQKKSGHWRRVSTKVTGPHGSLVVKLGGHRTGTWRFHAPATHGLRATNSKTVKVKR